MNDPKLSNPYPAANSAYDTPQTGVRSPLMLGLIVLWLVVIVTIVAAQFVLR